MNGVNKVILLGHVGKDPDIRYSKSGTAVANFSIATTERWKDKNTGEKQERTEWHRCTAWGRSAEVIGEYVKKGSPLFVAGKLQTRKWQDKEGVDRYTTEIVVDEFQLLGSRGGGDQQEDARPATSAAQKPAASQQDFDDDIPF